MGPAVKRQREFSPPPANTCRSKKATLPELLPAPAELLPAPAGWLFENLLRHVERRAKSTEAVGAVTISEGRGVSAELESADAFVGLSRVCDAYLLVNLMLSYSPAVLGLSGPVHYPWMSVVLSRWLECLSSSGDLLRLCIGKKECTILFLLQFRDANIAQWTHDSLICKMINLGGTIIQSLDILEIMEIILVNIATEKSDETDLLITAVECVTRSSLSQTRLDKGEIACPETHALLTRLWARCESNGGFETFSKILSLTAQAFIKNVSTKSKSGVEGIAHSILLLGRPLALLVDPKGTTKLRSVQIASILWQRIITEGLSGSLRSDPEIPLSALSRSTIAAVEAGEVKDETSALAILSSCIVVWEAAPTIGESLLMATAPHFLSDEYPKTCKAFWAASIIWAGRLQDLEIVWKCLQLILLNTNTKTSVVKIFTSSIVQQSLQQVGTYMMPGTLNKNLPPLQKLLKQVFLTLDEATRNISGKINSAVIALLVPITLLKHLTEPLLTLAFLETLWDAINALLQKHKLLQDTITHLLLHILLPMACHFTASFNNRPLRDATVSGVHTITAPDNVKVLVPRQSPGRLSEQMREAAVLCNTLPSTEASQTASLCVHALLHELPGTVPWAWESKSAGLVGGFGDAQWTRLVRDCFGEDSKRSQKARKLLFKGLASATNPRDLFERKLVLSLSDESSERQLDLISHLVVQLEKLFHLLMGADPPTAAGASRLLELFRCVVGFSGTCSKSFSRDPSGSALQFGLMTLEKCLVESNGEESSPSAILSIVSVLTWLMCCSQDTDLNINICAETGSTLCRLIGRKIFLCFPQKVIEDESTVSIISQLLIQLTKSSRPIDSLILTETIPAFPSFLFEFARNIRGELDVVFSSEFSETPSSFHQETILSASLQSESISDLSNVKLTSDDSSCQKKVKMSRSPDSEEIQWLECREEIIFKFMTRVFSTAILLANERITRKIRNNIFELFPRLVCIKHKYNDNEEHAQIKSPNKESQIKNLSAEERFLCLICIFKSCRIENVRNQFSSDFKSNQVFEAVPAGLKIWEDTNPDDIFRTSQKVALTLLEEDLNPRFFNSDNSTINFTTYKIWFTTSSSTNGNITTDQLKQTITELQAIYQALLAQVTQRPSKGAVRENAMMAASRVAIAAVKLWTSRIRSQDSPTRLGYMRGTINDFDKVINLLIDMGNVCTLELKYLYETGSQDERLVFVLTNLLYDMAHVLLVHPTVDNVDILRLWSSRVFCKHSDFINCAILSISLTFSAPHTQPRLRLKICKLLSQWVKSVRTVSSMEALVSHCRPIYDSLRAIVKARTALERNEQKRKAQHSTAMLDDEGQDNEELSLLVFNSLDTTMKVVREFHNV